MCNVNWNKETEVSRETAAHKKEWPGGQAWASDSPWQTELRASFFLWWKWARGQRRHFSPWYPQATPAPPHRWYPSVFWHELWSPQTGSLCNVRPAMNNLLITLIQQRGSRTPSDPPFISKALWWMESTARLSNQRLKSPLLPFPLLGRASGQHRRASSYRCIWLWIL